VSDPLVSVIVAAYNADDTLGPTLASILDQSHREIEVVVVDDGSTDHTAEIIERAAAADARVVPESYGGNRGRSFARNHGMSRATGDWISVVDADDLLARTRFEQMLHAAQTFPESRLITDDRIGWHPVGDKIAVEHRFCARHTWRVGSPRPLDRRPHFTDRFGHLDMLVRRDFWETTEIQYPVDMARGEDLAVYNSLLFWPDDPNPVRIAQPTYYYRLATNSRPFGAATAHGDMVRRVVETTGSDELRELYRKWQPAHSWLFSREDDKLAASGDLEAEQPADPLFPVTPDAKAGMPVLVGLKALQWMGRFEDRSSRPMLARDIARQLDRSV
jgi:glycosyltransferase involved in cell wall biosynthesis